MKNSLLSKLDITPKQIGYLMLANMCYALALDLFYVHNNIAAGGLAGIGTMINYFIPIPVGVMVFIMNLPIIIWGLTIKGKRYVLLSLIATALYSIVVDLLAFMPSVTDDKLVAAICGGILYGVASALAIKAQISTGGTDLLAKLLITKFKTLSIGKLFIMIDGTIVLVSMIVYGNVEAGIYAILAIATGSIVTDRINAGFNRAEVFYIFANDGIEEISNAILYDMKRGATEIKGLGMYAHSERNILMVVVKPDEVPKLKKIIHSADPSAFIIMVPANEIIGEGFEDVDLTTTIKD